MTETLTKIIVNCQDGTQEIVPLTESEIQQRETDALAYAEQKAIQEAEEAAKAEAKAAGIAALVALGLTEEQISAITGN